LHLARNASTESNCRHFTLPHGSQRVLGHCVPSRHASHARLVARGLPAQHSQQSWRVVIVQSESCEHVPSPTVDTSGGGAGAVPTAIGNRADSAGLDVTLGASDAIDEGADGRVSVVGAPSLVGAFGSEQPEARAKPVARHVEPSVIHPHAMSELYTPTT
jgi:hypothetical protein